jgi:hypothetical protein
MTTANTIDISEWDANERTCRKHAEQYKLYEGHPFLKPVRAYHDPVFKKGTVLFGRYAKGHTIPHVLLAIGLIGIAISALSALLHQDLIFVAMIILFFLVVLYGGVCEDRDIIDVKESEAAEQAWTRIREEHLPLRTVLAESYGLDNVSTGEFDSDGYAVGRATKDGQLYNITLLRTSHDGRTLLAVYQNGNSVPLAVTGRKSYV